MEITTLENWLWEAACSVRGPLDAPKYKDYILPLLFYKRLCDVYDDEVARLMVELGGEALARELAEQDGTLTKEDITHYHRVVVALKETMRLMAEIDEVIEAHGGWPIA